MEGAAIEVRWKPISESLIAVVEGGFYHESNGYDWRAEAGQ